MDDHHDHVRLTIGTDVVELDLAPPFPLQQSIRIQVHAALLSAAQATRPAPRPGDGSPVG